MRRYSVLHLILQFAVSPLHSSENAPASHELVVTNYDENSPAYHARFPVGLVRCAGDSCEMPTPATSSLKSARLSFSCIPLSAPTGFENALPDATVYSVQTPNVKGHVSLIDELPGELGGRMRELYFCLYGEAATLCGFAKTLFLKDGESADASIGIMRFLKTIVLTSDVRK
jgi:hypothetical protein